MLEMLNLTFSLAPPSGEIANLPDVLDPLKKLAEDRFFANHKDL